MSKSSPPPGTSDIFADEVTAWLELENTARRVFSLYGYGEIRIPIFEFTEVFQRGLGNETEVVQKEMYTFEDRGGRSLTLRPEGTAGVMRALSGTEAMNGVEQRVFYMGPMFRGERPSAGRRRQFHQIGVENAGKVS
ncbi:MAG: ATP phosphoribosyltransferase regulatory subunit, partial [Lentisphaeria bacterium]|nr:ATP phosphoribosyltransferase regulatory subunit [Lentisphaeria bacterium]